MEQPTNDNDSTVPFVSEEQSTLGEIRINHSVVANIVRIATLNVPGVHSVGGGRFEGIADMFGKREGEKGVRVSEDEGGTYEIEVRVLTRAMKRAEGNTSQAARLLGLKRTTFLDKLRTGGGNNDAAYANAAYDALLDEAATMAGADRLAKLAEAEAVMIADQPMLLIYQYVFLHCWDPQKLSGLRANGWGRWRFERIAVNP